MMIRCSIEDVAIEIDDDMPPTTLEAFESHLARVAGTTLSLYLKTIGDEPEPDDDDDGDPSDGDDLPKPIISFTADDSFDA